MNGFFERLGRLATVHWKAVIAVYLLASLAFLWMGSSIRLETSLAELLPETNRAARDFRALLAEKGTLDRLLVSIGLDPPPPDPADGLETLVEAARFVGGRLVEAGLATSARHGVDEEDLSLLSRRAIRHLPVLLEAHRLPDLREKLTPGSIRRRVREIKDRALLPGFSGPLKEMASRDPLGLLALFDTPTSRVEGLRPDPESGLFLSRDGRRLLLAVQASQPPTVISFSRRLVEALLSAEREAVGSVPGGESLVFDHAGGHLFALEDERRIRHDAAATSAFSLGGIALIYLFVIRRPSLWLVVLLPLFMTTVWTLGLASVYPGRLNMITVAFAAILLGIGDDAMIHMYLRERHERRQGLAAPHSAVAALAGTGRAITVATLSSAAAFLALAFVQFRGLAELGIISAIGMLTLLIGVLFFFPAALALLARRRRAGEPGALRLPLGPLLSIHDWSRTRRRRVLGAAAAGTVVMLGAALGLDVSVDLRSIRGEDPASAALARVMAPFEGSPREMMVVLHGPAGEGSGGALEEALGEAERLRRWCAREAAEGTVAGCDSPAAIAPPRELQEERFDALSSLPWEEAVHVLEEAASARGLDPGFFEPFAAAARGYRVPDRVMLAPEPSWFGEAGLPRTRIWFGSQERANELAREVRAALEDPEARIASVALVSRSLGEIIASDFNRAAAIVALAVALLSLAAYRQAGLLLVTLTPVALGTVWLLGTARLAGVELNLMSLMGIPVVFGLGVDYGVYLVDRWIREGRDPREALAQAGPAVLVTGLTTLAGFAALLGAELAGLRSLGFTVVVGAGYTLAAALLVLPLLLPRGSRLGGKQKSALGLDRRTAGAPAAGAARSRAG